MSEQKAIELHIKEAERHLGLIKKSDKSLPQKVVGSLYVACAQLTLALAALSKPAVCTPKYTGQVKFYPKPKCKGCMLDSFEKHDADCQHSPENQRKLRPAPTGQPEAEESQKLCRKPHWKDCVSRETYEGHKKELQAHIDGLEGEKRQLKDVIAKGFNEAAEVLVRPLEEENKRLKDWLIKIRKSTEIMEARRFAEQALNPALQGQKEEE